MNENNEPTEEQTEEISKFILRQENFVSAMRTAAECTKSDSIKLDAVNIMAYACAMIYKYVKEHSAK